MTIRFFCFAFIMLMCCEASAQIIYDGYEFLECEIYFSHAGERDGEFKLLFDAKIDRDSPESTWIRPDSHYLGWRVTLEQNKGNQEAVFHPLFANESTFRLPLGSKARRFVLRGTFSREGHGDELVTANIGDSFTIGGITATVRSLNRLKAELQLSSTGAISTLILSDTGELRTQQYILQEKVFRLQVEQRHSRFFRECLLYFGGITIFLFLAYGLVYLFNFIGLLQSRSKPRPLRPKPGK